MTSSFSATVRLLACDHCGAPLENSHAGPRVRCRYRWAQHSPDARDDSPPAVAARASCNPEERLARLRQQEGRPPATASMLDPGRHRLTAEAEGLRGDLGLVVRPGTKRHVVIELRKTQRPPPARPGLPACKVAPHSPSRRQLLRVLASGV